MAELPPLLQSTVLRTFREDGPGWLRGVPQLLAACERRWSLTLGEPFPNIAYNYVAPAVLANGTEVVLKAGVPNNEIPAQAAALAGYGGRGAVRLLAADVELGVLILERVRPGAMLSTLADDEAATAIAATVMRQIWFAPPPDGPFPTVHGWAAGLGRVRRQFGGGTGPLPSALYERAERLFVELAASAPPSMVLHGDLHHFNILDGGERGWLAIDPKGVVGDPGFDVYALLCNPRPDLLTRAEPGRILVRRVDQLAEALGFERDRVRDWGVAGAVLSAAWSVEDGGDWRFAMRCAELLAEGMTSPPPLGGYPERRPLSREERGSTDGRV